MADEEEVKDTRSTYQKVEDAGNKKYYEAKADAASIAGGIPLHSTTQKVNDTSVYEDVEETGNKKYYEAKEKVKGYIAKKIEQAREYNEREKPIEKVKESVKAAPNKIYTGMQKAEGILDRNIDFNAFGEDLSYLKEQAKSSARNIGLSEKQSARKYGDVQFPTLFGGSGGMFDTPERERKIRQVDLFATQEKYDPFTGERIPLNRNPIRYDPDTGLKVKREYTPVSEQKKEIAKNKMLIDIFESERHLTDYEKVERKSEREAEIRKKEVELGNKYDIKRKPFLEDEIKHNKDIKDIELQRQTQNKEISDLRKEKEDLEKLKKTPEWKKSTKFNKTKKEDINNQIEALKKEITNKVFLRQRQNVLRSQREIDIGNLKDVTKEKIAKFTLEERESIITWFSYDLY